MREAERGRESGGMRVVGSELRERERDREGE